MFQTEFVGTFLTSKFLIVAKFIVNTQQNVSSRTCWYVPDLKVSHRRQT